MAPLSGLAQAFFRPQKTTTTYSLVTQLPGTWQPPGRSLGELQVRGRVDGNVGQWCGMEDRPRETDRERRRRREGEGHPTHVSRMEVVEDIETLKSSFRSFSSSC